MQLFWIYAYIPDYVGYMYSLVNYFSAKILIYLVIQLQHIFSGDFAAKTESWKSPTLQFYTTTSPPLQLHTLTQITLTKTLISKRFMSNCYTLPQKFQVNPNTLDRWNRNPKLSFLSHSLVAPVLVQVQGWSFT